MTHPTLEHELHKRSSEALTALSCDVIPDIRYVFNAHTDLARWVSAVNICVRANNIASQTGLAKRWVASHLRDWVLILEHGSNTSDHNMQGFWASLMATSVLEVFAKRVHPLHVDLMAQLSPLAATATAYLYRHAFNQSESTQQSPDARDSIAVSAKDICQYLQLGPANCKETLRQLYELGMLDTIQSADDPNRSRHACLTPLGLDFASRLDFGAAYQPETAVQHVPKS